MNDRIVRCDMRTLTTLIDVDTLAAGLADDRLAILDCRAELGNPHWGEAQFRVSHIPGAQFLHLDRDLSGPITPQSGRHPLPDPHVLARRLGALGVAAEMQVVAYDQGNGAYASRLWWLLRWLGHRNVAVLDGGFAAWRAAGLPVEAALREPQVRHFDAVPDTRSLVDAAAVEDLRQRPQHLLVDARGADRFAGRNEQIDPVAGHIPGARNHPFTANLGPDGRFLPAAELRRRWNTVLGSQPPSALIAMCGSGVTACHNLLALEHAGLSGSRLYAGSWSEWIRDARRPVATGSY